MLVMPLRRLPQRWQVSMSMANTPRNRVRWMRGGGEGLTVLNSAHVPNVEQREAFNAAVLEFLKQ
jgi:pimeloyl-ACP methyl ester carboxylesterase